MHSRGRRRLVSSAILAALAGACSAEPPPLPNVPAVPHSSGAAEPTAAAKPAEPPLEYLFPEPERRSAGTFVALENNVWGVILDGGRALVSERGVSPASETSASPIARVERLPARFGGGFLFLAGRSLYTSATFDGPLRAIATVPSPLNKVSFGPDALLLRATNGERWVIDAKSGDRRAPSPVGLVDFAALDDGRAAAVVEAGGALVSTDSGKSWRDVRGRLRGAPGGVETHGNELFLFDRMAQGTRALRVDATGDLADVGPPQKPPPPKPDTRFRNNESPLRAAVRSGARVGPRTAVVAAGGDVLRVDLRSGAIVQTHAGVIPQNMDCEAVATANDVLFVCAQRSGQSVVVSGVSSGKDPRVERSFPTDGPFFLGEEGTLAYGGPCTPAAKSGAPASPNPPLPSVCTRSGPGQWETSSIEEQDDPSSSSSSSPPATSRPPQGGSKGGGAPPHSKNLRTPAPPAGDDRLGLGVAGGVPGGVAGGVPGGVGGAPSVAKPPPPPPLRARLRPELVRWIPRPGKSPIAVITSPEVATLDLSWSDARPWQLEGLPSGLVQALKNQVVLRRDRGVIERRWAATADGAVRALLDDGRAIEVSPTGTVTVWPFQFEKVASAGARALARSRDGRAFQTLDRGQTWGEVQGPPATGSGLFEPRACSDLGCDLAGFVRVGWEATAPAKPPEVKKVAAAPAAPDAPLVEIQCIAAGGSEAKAVQTTDLGTEAMALGAANLPKVPEEVWPRYERKRFVRSPVNIPQGLVGTAWNEAAPRALVHGFPVRVEPSDRPDRPFGEVVVDGPSAAASSFRQELMFVEPLVAGAPVRRVSFTLDAVAKATKSSGAPVAQLVSEGNFDMSAVVPVTPAPASGKAAPNGDVLASFQPTSLGTMYLLARGGAAPRAEMLYARPGGVVSSAALLAGGDLAALAVGDDGEVTVLRFGTSGVAELAVLAAPPETHLAPANPDAIAIGPRGDIALIRTPSGSEPPSAADPALLITVGPRVTALAPWLSALPASDPACVSDSDGYRATIQAIGPWARVAGLPFQDGALTGMTARVRWSAARVCIEAIEVPEKAFTSPAGIASETVLIAGFAAGGSGRASIEIGSEGRTPLSCTLAPR